MQWKTVQEFNASNCFEGLHKMFLKYICQKYGHYETPETLKEDFDVTVPT